MSRKSRILRTILALLLLLGVSTVLGLLISERFEKDNATAGNPEKGIQKISVEVAPVMHGPLALKRTFSGTLESPAQFVVAPKVNGRVERITVQLSDTVKRGQVVAQLDGEEFAQAVHMAQADLEVAKANLAEAKSAFDIANREIGRIAKLRGSGIMSESQYDAAKAKQLAKKAELDVAVARLSRAQSAVNTAKIRLGYTKVTASWSGGSDRRTVAERYIDEGETVSANTAILNIVELDPIRAVIFVTEQDYALLSRGQAATVTTDAYPGKTFQGRIERIAPLFKQETRQARVELTIANKSLRLKPGMFVRVAVVLQKIPHTAHIPEQAVHVRNDKKGVFLVTPDGRSVTWREVKVGIRNAGRVQIEGDGIAGRVVILGQRLLDEGSPIKIVESQTGLVSLAPAESP